MRGEHIEGHSWKVPAVIQAFLEKSHYILIVLTLAIGGYAFNSGLKDITPKPVGADTAMVQKAGTNTAAGHSAPSFTPHFK